MKFLTKINRNYLMLFGVVLVLFSFSGYFILKAILIDNTKENLLSKATLVEKQIAETGQIPNLKPLVEVKEISVPTNSRPKFSEEILFNRTEEEQEAFIEYSSIIMVNNKYYSIKLREAAVESEDLAVSIALSIFTLLLSAFAISYFITKRLNRTTWNIFEHNLKQIENFDFRENKKIQFRTSNIDEFDRLNIVVDNLTKKLKNDYLALKEFTENASHEIQTPLTIASLNLEEMLQLELTEESFRKVVTAINAVKRLSALNQNLLLLTKIENNQFASSGEIAFNDLIETKINEFDPMFKAKNIRVDITKSSVFHVKINLQLAEILINNLFSNAVNHNIDNGSVHISIHENGFKICNSGLPNNLNNETIYNRFVKGNSKSHGIGLAIVKQICDTNQMEIHYTNSEFHCFTITQKI